jgi:hypothetical protein
MRAPDTNDAEARWQRVKDVCRRYGIDGDKVMVGRRTLRAELERLTAQYLRDKAVKSPTPRQYNTVIEEGLAAITAFRDPYTLKHDVNGRKYHDMIAFFASPNVIKNVMRSLDELETELRASLVSNPRAVKSNAAESARNHYWFLLGRLWTKIAPHTRGKRKPLADFLQVATSASPSAIRNYLDRLPRKARSIANYPGYL